MDQTASFSPDPGAFDPPPGLFGAVVQAIRQAQARRLRLRLAGAVSSAGAFSAFVAVNAGPLLEEFRASALFDLLRLFRSDPDVFLASLREGGFALLEAVPLAGLCLLGVGAFLAALVAALARETWRRTVPAPASFGRA